MVHCVEECIANAFDMGTMKLQSSQGWAPRVDADPFLVGASYLGVAGSNTGMGGALTSQMGPSGADR